MKLFQGLIVGFCLLGATHLAKGQLNESAGHGIPGTLDPATGKFTTRIGSAANTHQNPEATAAATSVFFREDFQIKIANYDQPGTTAVCSVEMVSEGDSTNHGYDETSSVVGTPVSGGFTCDVPLLTLWLLQTPTSDSIYASVSVSIYTPGSPTASYGIPTVYRSSTQSLNLTQPGNTQTVVTAVNFTL